MIYLSLTSFGRFPSHSRVLQVLRMSETREAVATYLEFALSLILKICSSMAYSLLRFEFLILVLHICFIVAPARSYIG